MRHCAHWMIIRSIITAFFIKKKKHLVSCTNKQAKQRGQTTRVRQLYVVVIMALPGSIPWHWQRGASSPPLEVEVETSMSMHSSSLAVSRTMRCAHTRFLPRLRWILYYSPPHPESEPEPEPERERTTNHFHRIEWRASLNSTLRHLLLLLLVPLN